jgi:hypothetical protein
MASKIETVTVELHIQRLPKRVVFYVLQTPATLWENLPQKVRVVDADLLSVHYLKTFTLTVRGWRYEFAFYRSVAKKS